ncbi:MAG: class I SAM-dependent RNA methyltransferase [Kineosporiaceae bacterium]
MSGDPPTGPHLTEVGGEAGGEAVVQVGAPAHGGHAVARLPGDGGEPGRVVFVRHALPGETVRIRVTEGGERDRYWRADAVEVLRASPDRVTPPCPVAGPGGCGGCDLQHVSPPAQRRWKAAVVAEALARIGRLDPAEIPPVTVEALPGPGAEDGLRWRGRVRFAVGPGGRLGFRRHRSHDVVPVEDCPITHPDVLATGVTGARWPGVREVSVAVGDDGRVVRVVPGAGTDPARAVARGWRRPPDTGLVVDPAGPDGAPLRRGRARVGHDVVGVGVRLRVSHEGFWQPHPGAPEAYVAAVRDVLRPAPGDRLADLYSGVGLFAAALAADVGTEGEVVAVEADGRAVADARRSLHDVPRVRLVHARVEDALAAGEVPAGAGVVLDPPRAGAGLAVVDALAGLSPAAVAYVACDPAALARDIARFREHGYRLSSLRAFDAFPMTHHVECVAGLTRVPA